MDALLALIFVVTLVVTGVILFLTLWFGSVALLISPHWVGRQVVLRFWPERHVDEAALRRYRIVGCFGLAFAVLVTWQVLLELIPG